MSVSLLVGLLPYWYEINVGIYPVLDEIYFWNFLETFLGCWYTIFKSFWISCMSLSLLVGLLPYWKYINIGISQVLDEIYFWIFLETLLRCWYTGSKWFWIFCMAISLVVGILPSWNPTNLGIFPTLDEISLSIFVDTFLGCWYTFYK